MSSEDFSICESQTSIDLDGFETIDVKSIDLQDSNPEEPTIQQSGGSKCGLCGETGHNKRTCPKNKDKKEKKKPKKKKKVKINLEKKPKKTKKTKKEKVVKDEKINENVPLFKNVFQWLKTVLFKSVTTNFEGNFIIDTDTLSKINVIDINDDIDYDLWNSVSDLNDYTYISKTKPTGKKNQELHILADIEKNNITEQLNKVFDKDYVDLNDRFNKLTKKVVKSKVHPLISKKFIKGPKDGYGGLESISNNEELMAYVAGFQNLKSLVNESKKDWRKFNKEKDPLYFSWVILEDTPKIKDNDKKVLGYIRLKREIYSKNYYLRIVIREEGRGVGKKSVWQALKVVYKHLVNIYGSKEASKFILISEVNIANEIGFRAFKRWGMNLSPEILEKRYGKVYEFYGNIIDLIDLLNPDNKTVKIPDIIDLKEVYQSKFNKYNIVSSILNFQRFFKDELTTRTVLQNISDLLLEDGYAVFIVPDSNKIKSLCVDDSNEYNSEILSLKYNDKIKSDDLFGIRYRVRRFNRNEVNDYLVKNDVFVNLLEDYDFEIKFNETINNLLILKDNDVFSELYNELVGKTTDLKPIMELLEFLRVVIVKNKHKSTLSSFVVELPDLKETIGGGSNILDSTKLHNHIEDETIDNINNKKITPKIYYYLKDDDKCVVTGKITKIDKNTVFINNDIDNSISTLNIDELRYINNEELKHWGGEHMQFVKKGLDLKMSECRKSALYFKNPDSLWNIVRSPNKYKPFIYENLEKFLIIYDKSPKAKKHYLILPKQYLELHKLDETNLDTLNEMRELAVQKIMDSDIKTKYLLGFHRVNSQKLLHLHVVSEDVLKNKALSDDKRKTFQKPFFISIDYLINHLEDGKSIETI